MTDQSPPEPLRTIRPTNPQVARVAAFLCLSWDRTYQLSGDVMDAVDAARVRHEQAVTDAWDDGWAKAHEEMIGVEK